MFVDGHFAVDLLLAIFVIDHSLIEEVLLRGSMQGDRSWFPDATHSFTSKSMIMRMALANESFKRSLIRLAYSDRTHATPSCSCIACFARRCMQPPNLSFERAHIGMPLLGLISSWRSVVLPLRAA